MRKCKDCKYSGGDFCELTHLCISPNKEHNKCPYYYNANFLTNDICYNCKYYGGGNDWGLFCSHKEMYHHLGKFNDPPCKYYEKKG